MYFVQLVSSAGLDTYIGINYFQHKGNKQKLSEFIGTVLVILITLGTTVFFYNADRRRTTVQPYFQGG